MRILILGTSNSILKNGYVHGLRLALPPDVEIINMSVGASSGIQFAGWCAEDLTSFDYVIFDSIVNDESTFWFIPQFEYYSKIMFEMFSTIASQTQLVVIGFCAKKYISNPSNIYNFQKETTIRVGGIFLSAREFAIAHKSDYADDSAFIDEQHINPLIAHVFGKTLAPVFSGIKISTSKSQNFCHHFSTVDLTKETCGHVALRTNRWRSEKFLYMSVGDSIEFDKNQRAIGFYIDAKNTNGLLRLSSYAETRNLGLFYEIDSEKFLARFIALRRGMTVKTITVVKSNEEWEPARAAFPDSQTDSIQICISRLICWNPR